MKLSGIEQEAQRFPKAGLSPTQVVDLGSEDSGGPAAGGRLLRGLRLTGELGERSEPDAEGRP